MTTGADIVAEARTWLGTRWRHQGRCKGVATDCLGMVGGVAISLGLLSEQRWRADERLWGYGRTPLFSVLREACDEYMQRIALRDARPGDVLLMAFSENRHPQHFAIVSSADPLRIVHAHASLRKVVETSAFLPKSSIVQAYRFPGIEA